MKKWLLLLGVSLLLVACSPKETEKPSNVVKSSESILKKEQTETTESSEKRIEKMSFEKGSLIKAVENNDTHLVDQI